MASGSKGCIKARDCELDDSQIIDGCTDLETQKRLLKIRKIINQVRKLRREEKAVEDDNHTRRREEEAVEHENEEKAVEDDNQTRRRIKKIRRGLNKLQKKFHEEDDSEETKQPKLRIHSRILRKLNRKLELELHQQEKQLTNKILSLLWRLLEVERFKMRALPVMYSVVDVVYATKYLVAGSVLNLTFTARHDDVEPPKTFKASIFYGIKKPPQVKFVRIDVAT